MAKPKDPHKGGQQLPLITPDSDWRPPTELPDLRRFSHVALDTENRDGGLSSGRGPGWPYGDGHIAGVGAAWREGQELKSIYVPINHPDTECLPKENVARWLDDLFKSGTQLIFQNAPYDLGWSLADLGVRPPASARLHDTTAMAVMLDENRYSYTLGDLARWRGVPGKDEALLREAAASYGYHGEDVKKNLWRLPGRFVAPYGSGDPETTLQLFEEMMPHLSRDEVLDAYRLECDLIPMVLEMRRRGIRFDVDAAEQARDRLYEKCNELLKEVGRRLGEGVSIKNIGQTKWMERVHDAQGVRYPRTPKTNVGSFTAGKDGWMGKHEHWLPSMLAKAMKYEEAARKHVQGYLIDYAHRGRLHATVNQFRNEDGGTRSHRFSYADPPLQQVPERDEEIGPLIRGMFLPEEGEVWGAHDYSQQEYRLIVHFAAALECRRAEEAVALYRENPKTDFHALVVDWTGLDRKRAKDTNFAKAFGAGIKKFAQMIGRSEEEARAIYEQYDRELPFVSEAAKLLTRRASRHGYVRLLDGARSHFDSWEPADWHERRGPALQLEAARERYPGLLLTRAMTHKAFNRLIQGSAARQTKLAMRECWRSGIVPLLQMHDELDASHGESRTAELMGQIMRDAVELRVPTVVDSEFGRSWGEAKDKTFDMKLAA